MWKIIYISADGKELPPVDALVDDVLSANLFAEENCPENCTVGRYYRSDDPLQSGIQKLVNLGLTTDEATAIAGSTPVEQT